MVELDPNLTDFPQSWLRSNDFKYYNCTVTHPWLFDGLILSYAEDIRNRGEKKCFRFTAEHLMGKIVICARLVLSPATTKPAQAPLISFNVSHLVLCLSQALMLCDSTWEQGPATSRPAELLQAGEPRQPRLLPTTGSSGWSQGQPLWSAATLPGPHSLPSARC